MVAQATALFPRARPFVIRYSGRPGLILYNDLSTMSKRNPVLEGDWPWRYYIIGALVFAVAVAIIVCLHK